MDPKDYKEREIPAWAVSQDVCEVCGEEAWVDKHGECEVCREEYLQEAE